MAGLCEIRFTCKANNEGIPYAKCDGFMPIGTDKFGMCKFYTNEFGVDICTNILLQEETAKNGETCRNCGNFKIGMFQPAPHLPPQIRMACSEKRMDKFSHCDKWKPKKEDGDETMAPGNNQQAASSTAAGPA